MRVESIPREDIPQAVELVWEVFLKFEAEDYSPEGVEEFRRFIMSKEETDSLFWVGAWRQERLVGTLAMRGTHIALFFVREDCQRQGIGRAMFRYALQRRPADTVSVNASPFAVKIYRRLGFSPAGEERTLNGIRFTPMVWEGSEPVNIALETAHQEDKGYENL